VEINSGLSEREVFNFKVVFVGVHMFVCVSVCAAPIEIPFYHLLLQCKPVFRFLCFSLLFGNQSRDKLGFHL
jgi:hypothetical protein